MDYSKQVAIKLFKMELEKLENDLIEIISNGIKKIESLELKNDNSVVTNCDIETEKNIISYLNNNFSEIDIISEENIQNHKESYFLKNRFAIIDPIDGTENFYFLNNIFGSAISIVYDEINYHLIFIPKQNIKISTLTIGSFKTRDSKINLFSTSCLQHIDKNLDKQSCRILGSSTYMFYSILSGNANSYEYCNGAKIWDYYTGISLALNSSLGFEIYFDGQKINKIPINLKHRSNFKIAYNGNK